MIPRSLESVKDKSSEPELERNIRKLTSASAAVWQTEGEKCQPEASARASRNEANRDHSCVSADHRTYSGLLGFSIGSGSLVGIPALAEPRLSPAVQGLRFRILERNPSRLILAEQLRRRTPPRLFLEIDVGERLPAAVPHDESTVHSGGERRSGMGDLFSHH
jgi:hypothetical protein